MINSSSFGDKVLTLMLSIPFLILVLAVLAFSTIILICQKEKLKETQIFLLVFFIILSVATVIFLIALAIGFGSAQPLGPPLPAQ